MPLYDLLKYLHIVLAIVAIGFNLSYFIWLYRAQREPEHAQHVLRGIKMLDDRFANPAYGFLLITGVVLILIGPFDFENFWVATSIAIYVAVVVLAVVVFTPSLRRQIAALEAHGSQSADYQRLASRTRVMGVILIVLVLAIELLMTTKPTL
jgi:uncharacterized membrane protein